MLFIPSSIYFLESSKGCKCISHPVIHSSVLFRFFLAFLPYPKGTSRFPQSLSTISPLVLSMSLLLLTEGQVGAVWSPSYFWPGPYPLLQPTSTRGSSPGHCVIPTCPNPKQFPPPFFLLDWDTANGHLDLQTDERQCGMAVLGEQTSTLDKGLL